MATPAGLEPATSSVTGQRSHQLNYRIKYEEECKTLWSATSLPPNSMGLQYVLTSQRYLVPRLPNKKQYIKLPYLRILYTILYYISIILRMSTYVSKFLNSTNLYHHCPRYLLLRPRHYLLRIYCLFLQHILNNTDL